MNKLPLALKLIINIVLFVFYWLFSCFLVGFLLGIVISIIGIDKSSLGENTFRIISGVLFFVNFVTLFFRKYFYLRLKNNSDTEDLKDK